MIRSNLLAGGLAILSLSAFAVGAEETGLAVAANPLGKAEIDAAARTDALSIPTPGELLAALGKLGKLDWTSKFRAPIATSFVR